jgi:hypothetical protein
MRNIWLGLALVPWLAAAGADAWIHERGRRVPRPEQWVHAGLAIALGAFFVGVFAMRPSLAWAALPAFIALLAIDEWRFHRGIRGVERALHAASWIALAGFVAAWQAIERA